MNRCSKCLMPDNLPGSNFNADNTCSWCQTDYPSYQPQGETGLHKLLSGYKGKSQTADCLVGLSGGKDSTYALYRLVKHYGMKVEAFTYIHDGSTEFSIANARQTCEILGVKHHILSLPGHEHCKSFISYFKAWIAHPNTVSAGMTCVTCKHLHLLGSQLAKKRGIPLIVWSSSPLEYSPFLAIRYIPDRENQFKRASALSSGFSLFQEITRSGLFAVGFVKHFRTSLLGGLAVSPNNRFLASRYPTVKPLMFYDFERWEPEVILRSIRQELAWSVPDNVPEDWHSDCLFNVFKEYMFQKMLGVSYTDAHLSNQIRLNYLSRTEGITKLAASKAQYSKALFPALHDLGLDELISKVDPSCFEVDIK